MNAGQTIAKELAGSLSVTESGLQESESYCQLREQLQCELYEAEKMTEWFKKELQSSRLPTGRRPWEYIQQYADWTARLVLVRDRIERMGWSR